MANNIVSFLRKFIIGLISLPFCLLAILFIGILLAIVLAISIPAVIITLLISPFLPVDTKNNLKDTWDALFDDSEEDDDDDDEFDNPTDLKKSDFR